jgi:hypothetical protein
MVTFFKPIKPHKPNIWIAEDAAHRRLRSKARERIPIRQTPLSLPRIGHA